MVFRTSERVSGNDPLDMAARGRIGGYARAALYSPEELTGKARVGFLHRFETEVDPDGTLPYEERQRRAQAALRAHMAKLARKSAQKRQANRGRQPAGARK